MSLLKCGDLVEAIPPNILHCGSGIYATAIVVSTAPFVLVSESGDMMWSATQTPEKVRRIGTAASPQAAYKRWEQERKYVVAAAS